MSGANSVVPDITLEELSRLIRMLGMLGSSSDHEALVAARFAVRWVAEHQTSWEALLVPEPEPGVSAVVAEADPDEAAKLEEAAYERGYREGMKVMAAQVKAQAHMAAQGGATGAAPGSVWTASGAQVPPWAQAKPQGPVRASAAPQPAYASGTWQAVAQALLDRDAQGVPGVFRGSREADFVESLLARGWPTLTGPQDKWLRDIAARNGLSW